MTIEVLKILEKPAGVGQMRDADGTGKTKGQTCKDFSKLFIKVENGVITDTRFQTYGNPVSIAAASVVSQLILGRTLDDALKIQLNDVLAKLGKLDNSYYDCVQNALDLIPSAVSNYYRKEARENGEPAPKAVPAKKQAKAPKAPKTAEQSKPQQTAQTPTEQPQEQPAEAPKTEKEKKQTITVISGGTAIQTDGKNATASTEGDMDIFSEIDAITAKISEAVKKIKNK